MCFRTEVNTKRSLGNWELSGWGIPRTRRRRSCTAQSSFAPVGHLVPPALQALERGGTVALAGIHMSAIPTLDYSRDLFQERTLQSVTANTRQDGLDLLQVAAQIPIRTHTHTFQLEDANLALQELKAGNISGAGVLQIG